MYTPLDLMQEKLRMAWRPQNNLGSCVETSEDGRARPPTTRGSTDRADHDAIVTVGSSLQQVYNRILTFMLEKLADRDARRLGWPCMAGEGWYQTELMSRLQVPSPHANQVRRGARLASLKSHYTVQPFKTVPSCSH